MKTVKLGRISKYTYLLILDWIPSASFAPTLQKLLAHSEEMIPESNSTLGMKEFSEEVTEWCNKLVRKYWETLARKKSFETNAYTNLP